jgi:hypothetical protein
MEKRLVPYSVHLPEDIFNIVKQAAGERKASGLVRDAIISFVENQGQYDNGFRAGIEAAIKKVGNNKLASSISYKNELIADTLSTELKSLIK